MLDCNHESSPTCKLPQSTFLTKLKSTALKTIINGGGLLNTTGSLLVNCVKGKVSFPKERGIRQANINVIQKR